jgi:L-asparaginase
MRILSYNEKLLLIILVVCTLIMVYITVYFTINSSNNYNNIYVLNMTNYPKKGESHYILPNEITAELWNDLADKIFNSYSMYTSYIIICDKSNILYMATALSFIIENLSKPIILTLPNTFKKAREIAQNTIIPEVMIYSNGRLLRGVRTIDSVKGFISPYYPPLTQSTAFQIPLYNVSLKLINPSINVHVVKIFPGISLKYIKNIKGIILDSTSMNLPTSKNFLKELIDIVKKGTVIVLVNYTKVDPKIEKIGVILGYDMTIITAYMKLCFLLSNISDNSIMSQLMNHNLRGEITI